MLQEDKQPSIVSGGKKKKTPLFLACRNAKHRDCGELTDGGGGGGVKVEVVGTGGCISNALNPSIAYF